MRACTVCCRVRVLWRGVGSPSQRRVHLTAAPQRLVQFNLSDIGEGIREVTVRRWFVKEDDVVAQFDDICEVESDKATVSITSRYDGRVARLYHEVGAMARVGSPLVDIDVEEEEEEVKDNISSADQANRTSGVDQTPRGDHTFSIDQTPRCDHTPANDHTPVEPPEEPSWNKSLATPAVRRIASENKIKISDVQGTGKNGRVMKEDILAHIDQLNGGGKSKSVPMTSVQRVMTQTMTESLTIPQFVFSDEIDISKLVQLRSEVKESAAKKNIKLSYLPFFIKAISKGLSEYPMMNSTFDLRRELIHYKEYHNIGVAVDSPSGLVVPNVKNVQNLSVAQIAKELNRLQESAAKMKLAPDDLRGGTFSVSNIGRIAGTTATPLILPPEVAIVALGKIQRLPRLDHSGGVCPADILYVSWAADHRILDGATVARCSEVFRYYLQHPAELLLDL